MAPLPLASSPMTAQASPNSAQAPRVKSKVAAPSATTVQVFHRASTARSQAATTSSAATSGTLWEGASTPEWVTANDRVAVEVGTRFTVQADGAIRGMSFYKGPRNTGRHVGTLWDAAGKPVRTVTFTSESPLGWQYAAFSSPVRAKKGATFTASYNAPRGAFSLTKGYFGATPFVTGGLAVAQDGGVFKYGPKAFPAASSGGTNYWVDVNFAPTSKESPAPVATRDKYQQPFASTSIWNMPIGSAAQYRPLGMTPPWRYGTDEVYLNFAPQAPLRRLVERDYWWPWKDGDQVLGRDTGLRVRVADDWVVEPPLPQALPNRAAAALTADGKALEFQYMVRPKAGSDISFHDHVRGKYDLAGDGLNGPGNFGAHGGSGMTAIGGTIRDGELSGDEPIRHALALTMNMAKWGTKQGGKVTDGYRWPAIAADRQWNDNSVSVGYGTMDSLGGDAKDGLGMGSLLAIPAYVDLSTQKFETKEGYKLAWTHQNYGAYVVDNSGDDAKGSYDVHRVNVEKDALDEFPATDWDNTKNTPFGRDMDKIFKLLAVVDNNSATTIGGGGAPLQPLAPPIGN